MPQSKNMYWVWMSWQDEQLRHYMVASASDYSVNTHRGVAQASI